MKFENCTIIVPVIRETDLFEQVVETILDTCKHEDLAEFIIVIHPQYTAQECYASIERMRQKCEELGIAYRLLEQNLPGMGGAMRDALDIAKGSHTIIQNADMALNPRLVAKLIECAKERPNEITSVSRYMKGGKIEDGYKKTKLIWNKLSQKYCAILYQSKLTDYTYSYRICPTKYYHAVNWEELKHPFALEMTLKFLRLGIKVYEIPGNQVGGSQSGYAETMLYLPASLHFRFMSKKKILKQGLSLDYKNDQSNKGKLEGET